MDNDTFTLHKTPRNSAYSFKGYRIISDQVGPGELSVIWNNLEAVLQRNTPGAIVEFGCYGGTTSLFIRRLLDQTGQSGREFHVYDSFAGLPSKTVEDASPAGTQFKAGALAVSKKEFLHEFQAAHLQPPIIHKSWFSDLTLADVPHQVAFAFLDGDFYHSILDSLKLVWPTMQSGGMVLIDDYGREALPGPKRAIQDFFKPLGMPTIRQEHDIAIIKL